LLDAGISVNELAGGKFLSWFSLPLFLVGQFVAAYLAAAPANSFGFTTQYLLVIVCIDMIIVILFRARIERFVTTRQRPIS
jgi:hypothetical protein